MMSLLRLLKKAVQLAALLLTLLLLQCTTLGAVYFLWVSLAVWGTSEILDGSQDGQHC